VEVLSFLTKQKHPVGIEVIQGAFPKVNMATLYRMMTDFAERGLVHASDLGHGHVDYEIAHRPHHHHAVCESCGAVEDVYPCEEECAFEKAVLKSSALFKEIKRQQTVFFGVCKKCAA
jgi:Fe2+ or Zn2+ uptake regulation protein